MWLHERHQRIIALLNERQRLSTAMFAAELQVSQETIRRDLIELEQSGRLSRVHGGATAAQAQPEVSYVERSHLHMAEKHAIGRRASALIERGMCCFVDAGSTTHALASHMASLERIKVITNSVDVASTLAGKAGIEVLLLGGRLEADVPATYGDHTVAEILRHHVDLALISPVSVDVELGAMDYAWHEAELARAMLGHAKARVLLADARKLGVRSRVQICPTQRIDVLVTDAQADRQVLEALSAAGVGEIFLGE